MKAWLARAAFLAALAAVALPVAFAGTRSIAVLALTVAGVVVLLLAGYWFLATAGVLRWLMLAIAAAAPLLVLILLISRGLLWIVLVSIALAALCVAAGAEALAPSRRELGMQAYEAAPPKQPFLIMNPHSGGGKVTKFGLKERAESLGAEVALLEGPGTVDVEALARDAVGRGADLLGVAGGDGTQALVAAIAAEHDLPFLVISAGTRNHFALDLGIDREAPLKCLDALADGVELRVDLGEANGRTFVNNASFGAYAEVVQSPSYREDKVGTTLKMLPDLLTGRRGAQLRVQTDERSSERPQAVLVSNNPYGTTDLAGLGRRARLDAGELGVAAVSVDSVQHALKVLRRTRNRGLERFTTTVVVISSDESEIPAGVDGEAVTFSTPVHCTIHQKALRVRLPRDRPGVRRARPKMDWVRLRQLALSQDSAGLRPSKVARQM